MMMGIAQPIELWFGKPEVNGSNNNVRIQIYIVYPIQILDKRCQSRPSWGGRSNGDQSICLVKVKMVLKVIDSDVCVV